MPSRTRSKVWATLLTKSSYLPGLLVFNHSLKAAKSKYPLIVMVTPSLPEEARKVVAEEGLEMVDISYLEPKEKVVLKDDRFHDTWTKLAVFQLDQFETVVLLDSDMLVRQNMDELMEMDLPQDWIAASHACTCNPRKLAHYPKDWVPENCAHTRANLTTPISPSSFSVRTHHLVNSGLVVLHPSQEAFEKLTEVLTDSELVSTFSFPDQDLLAHVYKNKFQPLGYQYNALKTLRACHAEMWRDEDVKNVHYILDKPWSKRVEKGDANELLYGWWWDEFGKVEGEWKGKKAGWEVVERNAAPKIQN